jgi:DHA2 family multidrug resistance protein-like MFS transporter
MTSRDAPRAGRREWIGLAVLALPCLLYSMDLTVLNLAVPSLSADLKPTSAQLLWIVDIYGFVLAGSLITMGTLGDRIGRRRLLLTGAAAFGVASVLAAFSTSAEMLIATRALLGVAGATLAPSTLSLIRNMFLDPRQRTTAIGVWVTCLSAGGALGPLIGGMLLEHFWWGSAFLIGVPVMVLLLALGPVLLPEFREPAAGRIDLLSAALSLVAVLAVIYGLKQAAQDGLGWLPSLSVAAGLTVGATFLRRQCALREPLIDLQLFRVPAFSAAMATNTLAIFAAFGAFLFTAQYLQLVLGLSPVQAGLWTLPESAGFIVGSILAPVLARRMRPAYVISAGLVLAAAGLGLLTQVGTGSGLAILVTGSAVLSLGISPVVTLATDLIVGAAPPERAGAAAAMSETATELGGALGIAILGSIGAAVYRAGMAHAVMFGVPPEAAEAARGTLGGAGAATAWLPMPLGGELLATARDAFAQGFSLAAAITAVLVLAMAVVAATMLRRVDAVAPSDERPDTTFADHTERILRVAAIGSRNGMVCT